MKRLWLMALTCALTACSGGVKPASDQALGQKVAPNEASQGKFVAQAQADQKSVAAALDCSGSSSKIDDRLAAGQIFMTEENWLALDGSYVSSGKTRSKIISVDRAEGLIQKDGLTIGNDGTRSQFKAACRLSTTGSNAGSIQCQNFASTASAKAKTVVVQQRVCDLKSDGKSDKKTDEAGVYRFMNGQSVAAIQEVIQQTGDIECQSADGTLKPAGHGTLRSVLIASDQIPSSNGVSCAAASDIFQYDIITDDHGVIQSLRKSELVDFHL